MDYKTISSQEVFNGRVMRVTVDEILLPNGKMSVRETVHNRDAAVVLPIDDDGGIFLVRQYRHSVRRLVLEVPAGVFDGNETPEQCALRELEEEIGLKANVLTKVCAYHGSIGICSGMMHLFIAEDFTQGMQNLDPDEFLTIEKYTVDECEKMIQNGDIVDGKTILAIFAYKALK
ncbi:MAG: NUDIX hydrolase [Defluviitaleaceae bacterium]|nr:NUDIX hydrolase [Defluviitaleaceae bacterium]